MDEVVLRPRQLGQVDELRARGRGVKCSTCRAHAAVVESGTRPAQFRSHRKPWAVPRHGGPSLPQRPPRSHSARAQKQRLSLKHCWVQPHTELRKSALSTRLWAPWLMSDVHRLGVCRRRQRDLQLAHEVAQRIERRPPLRHRVSVTSLRGHTRLPARAVLPVAGLTRRRAGPARRGSRAEHRHLRWCLKLSRRDAPLASLGTLASCCATQARATEQRALHATDHGVTRWYRSPSSSSAAGDCRSAMFRHMFRRRARRWSSWSVPHLRR